MENLKFGVALGGGGARGFAHIGLLSVLEKYKIPIDCLAGTSMGGLIAALYSAGFSASQLEEEAYKFSSLREIVKLVEISPPRRGIIDHKRIQHYLAQLLGDKNSFESCQIPLGLCAVDLFTAREVHFLSGELIPAIMATISFPGVFPPVMLGDLKLVDGGIFNNVPVNIVRGFGARFVLAMNVELDYSFVNLGINKTPAINLPIPTPEAFHDYYHSCLLMIAKITELNLKQSAPDILLNPHIPLEISEFFGFNRAGEIIDLGKKAAYKALPQIIELLENV